MDSAPSPKTKKINTFKIINSQNQSFTIKFSLIGNEYEILVTSDSVLSLSYKVSLEVKEFQKLNKYFRQFDTIEEIYEFINGLEKLNEKIDIEIEDKFVKLTISFPSISKANINNNIQIMLPQIEVNEKDLIIKLCEKVNKIDILESKINYLFNCLGKSEKDFFVFEELKKKLSDKKINIDSKIINFNDLIPISIGIQEKLKKNIKDIKLLYRASRDGDGTQFHSKCDGKPNTVTFVKAKNGRKFGGFAEKEWNSNDNWINDPNAFVFSLDYNECYYYNNNGSMIYGGRTYGPIWGYGHDLYLAKGCLSNNSSGTAQSSFDYKGKQNTLSGTSNFQVEDYETYELILE